MPKYTFPKNTRLHIKHRTLAHHKSTMLSLTKSGKIVHIIVGYPREYTYFVSFASDHQIVSAQIRLTLRANKKKKENNKPHDWSSLKNNHEVRKSFIIKVKNRFEVFQSNSSTLTDDASYKHFETACKEITNNIIPLKPKLKKRIQWEKIYSVSVNTSINIHCLNICSFPNDNFITAMHREIYLDLPMHGSNEIIIGK